MIICRSTEEIILVMATIQTDFDSVRGGAWNQEKVWTHPYNIIMSECLGRYVSNFRV